MPNQLQEGGSDFYLLLHDCVLVNIMVDRMNCEKGFMYQLNLLGKFCSLVFGEQMVLKSD